MEYRQCNRCIMDTSDPEITFDENGYCNHCRGYYIRAKKELHYDNEGYIRLQDIIKNRVKGRGKKYDCIIGLSGGLDSSFVAYNVVKLGLKPLAISIDNRYDTEIAKNNVEKLVAGLKLDWIKYDVDWNIYREMQLAFLQSGVINIEAPTDHAITTMLYDEAIKQGVKWVITGSNIVTEAIMPKAWGYDARDWKHIKSICKQYGITDKDLNHFPHMNLWDWFYVTFMKEIKFFPILNYIPYNKTDAIKILQNRFDWEDCGPKHFENVFTRLFQGYILPTKFGIDKRKAHLSTLICSGQITREYALEKLDQNYYHYAKDYFRITDILNISVTQFHGLLNSDKKEYTEYKSNRHLLNIFKGFIGLARRVAIAN